MKTVSHWIDGHLAPGRSGRVGPVGNPATGQQEAEVDFASTPEVDAAVSAMVPIWMFANALACGNPFQPRQAGAGAWRSVRDRWGGPDGPDGVHRRSPGLRLQRAR